jgi:DNA-binding CsgD family transcriptional regulator/PAS domain-containing protein
VLSAADNKLLTLVGNLNNAITDPECWPDVLQQLQDVFGGSACAIASHHCDTGNGRLVRSVNINAEFERSYAERYARGNAWLRKETCFRKPGTVWTSQQIRDDEETLGSDYYLKWLKPQGLMHQIYGVLDRHENAAVYLVLARAEGEDAFAEDDVRRLAAILPAFASVLRLEHLVRNLTARAADTWTMLDHLAPGIALVDERGRIMAMNWTASEIARKADGLTVENGHLSCTLPREQARLRRTVEELLAADPSPPAANTKAFTVSRTDGAVPLHLILTRLSKHASVNGSQRQLLGVFVSDPERFTAPRDEWIRDLYGLTRVESEIALLICQGHSPDDIATRIRVSVHTVRSYLKQKIFRKLGVNRQAAMVGRLLGGPGQLRSNRDDAANQSRETGSWSGS